MEKYIINDYSPNYDYMIDGDKIYSSVKGKNEWKDISHIEKARNNLYSFVRSKQKAPYILDKTFTFKEIPTKNKIHIIDNYSPNYNYIVEGDKMYSSKKGQDHWIDISDNDKARANLYNFLGTKYNFKGYEDDEKEIWNQIKLGTFNYLKYKEEKNKPAPVKLETTSTLTSDKQLSQKLVTVRVSTVGGGFTNIEVPEYMTEPAKGLEVLRKLKDEYIGQANLIAYQKYPHKYADPINNAANWLPFAILTGGRGLENMGFNFVSPLVNRMIQGASNVGGKIVTDASNLVSKAGKAMPTINNFIKTSGNYLSKIPQAISDFAYSTPMRQALTKSIVGSTVAANALPMVAQFLKIKDPGSSELKLGWNMLMDGDYANLIGAAIDYGVRHKNKTMGGHGSDMPVVLLEPNHIKLDEEDLVYMYPDRSFFSEEDLAYLNNGLDPFNTYDDTYDNTPIISFTGDTIPVNKRRYILPEVLDVNSYKFKHRNRGLYAPIQSEAALITSFFPFVPYERKDIYKDAATFIGYDSATGLLKAGDISLFGPGDYLTKTYANDISTFKKDNNGNIVYKQAKGGNNARSVPVVITANGKQGSLNILTDLNTKGSNKGKTYGSVSGGRVLVKVGDEFRLLSGSAEDIELLFEKMKSRNLANYGTFYTLDNGSYNRALRTYDKLFTSLDLKEYDNQHRGGGGHFLYITE